MKIENRKTEIKRATDKIRTRLEMIYFLIKINGSKLLTGISHISKLIFDHVWNLQEPPTKFHFNTPGTKLHAGSTITGEISSVNHRTPSSAQYVEGRVGLSNDQKRANKREADARSRQKKKQMEERMMNDLERQEKCSGELERENNRLKWKRDQLEVDVQEENRKILNQLLGILVEQNTEINIIGEGSMSHDGLNNQREMNQASITNADTIFRENASMNLQTLPRSAPPAGSSGSTDDHKQARKRIADKKCRDKKKREINGVLERIKELETKNIKLELDNAVLNAVAIQSQKTLTLLRHISALMTFENARKNSLLEEVLNDYMNHGQGNTPFNMQLPSFGVGDQGSTSFNEDLNWFLDGCTASVEYHKSEIEPVLEPISHD